MEKQLEIRSVCLRDAARGLAQQMVFWGHDVRHRRGNCLVAFGMQRSPSPGLTGTSCYSMMWESGKIELHGAVASWTPLTPHSEGCMFARDHARIDLWSGPQPPVPGRQHGTQGPAAVRWASLQPLIRWLISYEKWIKATHGPEWRKSCWISTKKLPKGKTWLPPEFALTWWELAATSIPPRPRTLLNR